MTKPKRYDIKVGDEVKYRTTFLRSIGAYTGDMPFARGIVLEVAQEWNNVGFDGRPLENPFVRVDWRGTLDTTSPDGTSVVHRDNLVPKKSIPYDGI